MKFEADEVTMLTGVRHGQTLGGPIAIMIGNSEWPKWTTLMSADPIDPTDPEAASALDSGRGAKLTRPRPGHADFAGMLKYDFDEARPILERASARETAARVAAATAARNLLRATLGVRTLTMVPNPRLMILVPLMPPRFARTRPRRKAKPPKHP